MSGLVHSLKKKLFHRDDKLQNIQDTFENYTSLFTQYYQTLKQLQTSTESNYQQLTQVVETSASTLALLNNVYTSNEAHQYTPIVQNVHAIYQNSSSHGLIVSNSTSSQPSNMLQLTQIPNNASSQSQSTGNVANSTTCQNIDKPTTATIFTKFNALLDNIKALLVEADEIAKQIALRQDAKGELSYYITKYTKLSNQYHKAILKYGQTAPKVVKMKKRLDSNGDKLSTAKQSLVVLDEKVSSILFQLLSTRHNKLQCIVEGVLSYQSEFAQFFLAPAAAGLCLITATNRQNRNQGTTTRPSIDSHVPRQIRSSVIDLVGNVDEIEHTIAQQFRIDHLDSPFANPEGKRRSNRITNDDDGDDCPNDHVGKKPRQNKPKAAIHGQFDDTEDDYTDDNDTSFEYDPDSDYSDEDNPYNNNNNNNSTQSGNPPSSHHDSNKPQRLVDVIGTQYNHRSPDHYNTYVQRRNSVSLSQSQPNSNPTARTPGALPPTDLPDQSGLDDMKGLLPHQKVLLKMKLEKSTTSHQNGHKTYDFATPRDHVKPPTHPTTPETDLFTPHNDNNTSSVNYILQGGLNAMNAITQSSSRNSTTSQTSSRNSKRSHRQSQAYTFSDSTDDEYMTPSVNQASHKQKLQHKIQHSHDTYNNNNNMQITEQHQRSHKHPISHQHDQQPSRHHHHQQQQQQQHPHHILHSSSADDFDYDDDDDDYDSDDDDSDIPLPSFTPLPNRIASQNQKPSTSHGKQRNLAPVPESTTSTISQSFITRESTRNHRHERPHQSQKKKSRTGFSANFDEEDD